MRPHPLMIDPSLAEPAAALLPAAGLPSALAMTRLPSANNRVFRLDLPDRAVVLKAYFNEPEDKRPRLRTEFAFSEFAWASGLRNLPRPLIADEARNMALYDHVVGGAVAAESLRESDCDAVIAFIGNLNAERHRAAHLPEGSEACFAISGHLDLVARRIARLSGIDRDGPLNVEAAQFAKATLAPSWAVLRRRVMRDAERLRPALDGPLPIADRCLSPSDLGFHNTLRARDGQLFFLDFEYGGWDDPAKLAFGFFSQVAVPVPEGWFEQFVGAVASLTSDPALHRARAEILLPVYRMKWITIVLNDFLPVSNHRRRFALARDVELARKKSKLETADRLHEAIAARWTR